MTPKVFISYSWTSPGYQAAVKQWAERLIADGVDVVLDIYDLKEGHDKFAFMERMVTDSSVTHVMMLCDKAYAQKADTRKAGVGAESQIISKEVYEKVGQSKFIPIVCELDPEGNPYLPTFLKSRIWINFSTAEAVNENWEQLIRVLFGKPLHEKPQLGKPPTYLRDEGVPASPAISKFSALKQAILQGKPALDMYRQDFLDACIQYADSLRIRQQPNVDTLGERVLADCGKLKLVRDHIIDWVLLEASAAPSEKLQEALLSFLERMLELKARPREVTAWNDAWFEAHSVFVCETFLYIVAALLKAGAFRILHEVFASHYLLPETERDGHERFGDFTLFYGHSNTLQAVLATPGRKLLSPTAALIKQQADRSDIPFDSVIEAELVVLMMTFITPEAGPWYPGTLLYASSRSFPIFVRATQHKGFEKVSIVTGINEAEKLRAAIKEGQARLGVDQWRDFSRFYRSLPELMNLGKLDTLR
jgi:hypothetical protein